MAVYDDKSFGIIKVGDRGNSFIINKINAKSDVVFKASYIVASDLCVRGKVTALFDLIVLGNVEADDIEVKGKFICLGDCVVNNTIVVQDKMIVNDVKANSIEVHDQITAQQIEINTIKADGNIIVGQTLSIEDIAYSEQHILCGDTAYGAGKISAQSIISCEELDMDNGVDAVVNPNIIAFGGKQEQSFVSLGKKFADKNDFDSYFAEMWGNSDDVFQYTIMRWGRALRQIDAIFKEKEVICFNLGLLLTLTEIFQSVYFQGWDTISKWWTTLSSRFEKIANGEDIGLRKKMSIDEFTINKRVKHNKYGKGKIVEIKKSNVTTIYVLFDDGKTIPFKLDLADKFFSHGTNSEYTADELIEKLYIDPMEYGEWLAYLSILDIYGHMYSDNLCKIINDKLYSKIGVKTKFILDRIKDNGWDEE